MQLCWGKMLKSGLIKRITLVETLKWFDIDEKFIVDCVCKVNARPSLDEFSEFEFDCTCSHNVIVGKPYKAEKIFESVDPKWWKGICVRCNSPMQNKKTEFDKYDEFYCPCWN
jgi:hypothetical protein